MNKVILSFINQFMIEHQDEIVEVITNSNEELSKQWEEQGNSVKEYLGLMEEKMNKIIEFKIKKINEDKYTWSFSSFENKVIKEGFKFEYEREVDSGGIFVTNENTRLEYCVSKRVGKHDPTLYINLKDVNKIFTVSKEEAEDIKEIFEEVNFRYDDFEEFLED